ncbi:hypothetical protein ABRY23_12810 [Melioribacteraceae bacterium 4301-Me]|uniref:hypothetical protein n=1 Tax=Pyranulibacter aquaticus TaxID=3163344 RepID=UPI0035968373
MLKGKYALIVLMVIIIGIVLAYLKASKVLNKVEVDYSEINKLEVYYKKNFYSNEFKYIFLIRLEDFNCTLCFNDFLYLSDKLNKKNKIFNNTVLYLVERDYRDFEIQQRIIKKWKQVNNISFEVGLVNNFSDKLGIKKSCVMINNGKKFDVIYFPFNQNDRKLLETI